MGISNRLDKVFDSVAVKAFGAIPDSLTPDMVNELLKYQRFGRKAAWRACERFGLDPMAVDMLRWPFEAAQRRTQKVAVSRTAVTPQAHRCAAGTHRKKWRFCPYCGKELKRYTGRTCRQCGVNEVELQRVHLCRSCMEKTIANSQDTSRADYYRRRLHDG